MIKISICFLYARLFSTPAFQRAIWATQALNVLLIILFVGADLAQCQPLSFFWEGWDGEHEGSCFNVNATAYAHSAVNIALDVWMLALPASQVWRLNLGLRSKLDVFMMFSLGIL